MSWMKGPLDVPQHEAKKTAPEAGASAGAGEAGIIIFRIGSLDTRE